MAKHFKKNVERERHAKKENSLPLMAEEKAESLADEALEQTENARTAAILAAEEIDKKALEAAEKSLDELPCTLAKEAEELPELPPAVETGDAPAEEAEIFKAEHTDAPILESEGFKDAETESQGVHKTEKFDWSTGNDFEIPDFLAPALEEENGTSWIETLYTEEVKADKEPSENNPEESEYGTADKADPKAASAVSFAAEDAVSHKNAGSEGLAAAENADADFLPETKDTVSGSFEGSVHEEDARSAAEGAEASGVPASGVLEFAESAADFVSGGSEMTGEPKDTSGAEIPAETGDGSKPAPPLEDKQPKRRSSRTKNSKKTKEKSGKKSAFWKFYKIFLAALLIIGVFMIFSVYQTMQEMHANDPVTYIKASLNKLSDAQLCEIFTGNSDYETPDETASNVRDFLKSDEYDIKKSEKNVYRVVRDKETLMTVTLKPIRTVNKLGMLNYEIFELGSIETNPRRELYHVRLELSGTTAKINGKDPVPGTYTVKSPEGFSDGGNYVQLPEVTTIDIRNLTKLPEITFSGTGEPIVSMTPEIENLASFGGSSKSYDVVYSYVVSSDYARYNSLEEAGVNFDALAFGETWSKFLTQDLSGSRYGFYTVAENFIKDSALYKKAWAWATGIDITFTSRHSLKNPAFTNEQVSNVVVYSPNAVSVDVYLEKNMLLATGADRTDVFNSTLYLVNYEGAWKVVNIKGAQSEKSE